MVDVVLMLVTGVDGFVYPNENFGVLSTGLGGSGTEVVLDVVVAAGGWNAEVDFVVLGAGAGVFVT